MVDSGSKNYLFKGGELYAPEARGKKDVLIAGDRILRIDEEIPAPEGFGVEVIDATGKLVIPGLVDLHVHVTGGGGESGPASRVPEISPSDVVEAGVTTVAGLLGTDDVSRSPEDLLVKVKGLNETVTALGYTGSYHLPSPTLTGSVKEDIALIDEIVGVKCAISDHRSSQPTTRELARLASEARVGGMLGDHPGLVHVHVGGGAGGLDPLIEVAEETDVPLTQFLPTHVGRDEELLSRGMELVKRGGYIDITCPSGPLEREEESLLGQLADDALNLRNVTLSSDSNGSLPEFDEEGNLVGISRSEIGSLFRTFTGLVKRDILSLPEALGLVSENPARRLGVFDRKGSIEEGKDPDLLVLTPELELEKLFAGGELLLDGKETLVEGTFE